MKRIIIGNFSNLHERITGVKPPSGFIPAFGILIFLLTAGTLFYSSNENGLIWTLYILA